MATTPRATPVRSDPATAEVVLAWRRLTTRPGARRAGQGEPTVVACSGGADSCALLGALATVTDRLVVAHVVHDLRPAREAAGDRDAVRELAARLGLAFAEAAVEVCAAAATSGGDGHGRNLEAVARRLRYGALAKIAVERGIRFVAVGHQADDQLETMLMALLRGAGPRGLAGMRRSRRLSPQGERIRLIRPLLAVPRGFTRTDSELLCERMGIDWREDVTNGDRSRLRAAVRAEVLPVLARLRPGVQGRAVRTAEMIREADFEVSAAVRGVMVTRSESGDEVWCARDDLRSRRAIVAGGVLRRMHHELAGTVGADRLTGRVLEPVIRAVMDTSTEPREFDLFGAVVCVSAHRVGMTRRGREQLC